MNREWIALGLLALLLAGSLWNIGHVDSLTGEVKADLILSRAAAAAGDGAAAAAALQRAVERWERAAAYTEIFIRHPEIDTLEDSFFQLRLLLEQEEPADCLPAYDQLLYHLDAVAQMEHLRPGSVF